MTPNINEAEGPSDSSSESATATFDQATAGNKEERMATESTQESNGHSEDSNQTKEHEIFVDALSDNQKVCADLPVCCLKEGLEVKRSAANVDSWIALALTLDGRDKITKVLQYLARLLSWRLAGNPSAERFKALKESLTTCRKAFRLGRSFIELRKIQELQVPRAVGVSLRQTVEPVEIDRDNGELSSRKTLKEMIASIGSTKGKKFLFDKVYRPLVLAICSLLGSDEGSKSLSSPLWKTLGTALKMAGLLGFWAGDNVSFLSACGFLDDLRTDKAARLNHRNETSTAFSKFANRSYFFGALAGLYVNLKIYLEYRANNSRQVQDKVDDEGEKKSQASQAWETAKAKEFSLFLALVKSCADVLVFSNNPGIDLWMKLKGKKLHEGIHCMGGLVSASTVLYNNFPNK
ncbi:hypothetical protein FisN_4Hh177 [Fistulifera solaris]|jgi:hypothetical protein|uniref:Peroxisomal membrane protein 11C n=1 Tax=Fistulifera solaris TaxID=1519565 RepID=A0A1Z5K9B7_FISSO|nr:hypothetical protein FisN_4Hh177 [Fistulifera solaris]|eukprot:GAX22711.1 hypothetical protein FisN_4Hh177 [Fistulifera solaris]